ncbi:hypothetical protein QT327_16685 [Olivibacter sp. 47]|nr:hypothetical protein [Olivibacter sp. 47]MDM8175964.1 hypothetical protein [Olivibacter sp. 47]
MKRKRGISWTGKLFSAPITLTALAILMEVAEKKDKCIPYEGL